MIVFEKITYKNFLSVGDNPVEIDLTKNKTTLIVGANGEGKSILLDALSFVLFGKPHRNVNKPQLVNSINGKLLQVEIDFSIGSDKYHINRGMHPNVFEIFKNGNMLNQDSTSRDYQKVLETNILKLNHKSFHQIVVLGSSSFIPFMQLPAYHRREVIEDLLDISIFSKMNLILREKKHKMKDTVNNIQSDLEQLNAQIKLQQKHINQLHELTSESKSRIEKEIKTIEDDINDLKKKNNDLLEKQNALKKVDLQEALKQKKAFYEYEGNIKSKINTLKKQQSFFEDNDTCPSCSQSIIEDTKKKMISSLESKLEQFENGYKKLESQIKTAEESYEHSIEIQNKHNAIFSQIESNNRFIISKEEQKITKLDTLVESRNMNKLDEYKLELNDLYDKSSAKRDEHSQLSEYSSYFIAVDELLKDTGIKTKIIRQYLPIMNKLVNEYLQTFDFFVSFTIDENFNEKIRSRHRDDFSYASFSEGEKSRIDLALMFTWRQIAKLKNSTNTNLLLLDETFDSSLDSDGVENLLKLLYTMDVNTNTFIISHKSDVLEGKFENKILFKKVNNFTEMFNANEVSD
jgi:DNA repair exonuclease SbcCD ATPase subunit